MLTDILKAKLPIESHNQILELPTEKTTSLDSRNLKAESPNRSQDLSDSDQLENGYEEDMENGREQESDSEYLYKIE